MNRILVFVILSFIIGFLACTESRKKVLENIDIHVTDDNATYETKALYYNLKKLVSKKILFGHQDATAYGIGWKNEDLRSDVNDVCGSYPAIYGWELSGIGGAMNIDSVNFDRIKFWVKSAFERGGINTFSWHMNNPVSYGNAWDTTHAVQDILPGGSKHEYFIKQLDLVADFFRDLKSKKGTLIPVFFRPFHENNGSWFWWGAKYCSSEQYKDLYRFTVKYLKETRNVHNLLYVYAPDIFNTSDVYLERYPGNEYVDVLGFDDYYDFQKAETTPNVVKQLEIVVKLANENDKLAAFTETGSEAIKDNNWFTESLLNPIKTDSLARQISWIMVWRNANKKHHFAPYPGHASVRDFIKFENDPITGFEDDLPPMYEVVENH